MKGIEIEEFDDGPAATVKGSDALLDEALRAGALDAAVTLTLEGKLTRVPPEIGRLRALTTLRLDAPGIADVSDGIFACTALRTLEIAFKSKLTKLPAGGWGKLAALERLTLPGGLSELPADLGDATALRGDFDLRLHGKLRQLPASLGRLARVESLLLHGKIDALPPLGGLRGLQQLVIDGAAKLRTLPEDIGGLSCLTLLHVQGTAVAAIPASIGQCRALRELSLGQNRIAAVPDALAGLDALETLELGDNPLSALPDGLGSAKLRRVGLRGTRLTRLPAGFAALTTCLVVLPAGQKDVLQANSGALLAQLERTVSVAWA